MKTDELLERRTVALTRTIEKQELLSDNICRLSAWIDGANADRDPEAGTWGRIAKISEECGEVVAAYIGATGQNPRKGVTHTKADVEKELYDVAVAALGAIAHLHNNDVDLFSGLLEFGTGLVKRAGIDV